ncbi:MAG TPA: hypothetical protein VHX66_01425 [Solirubrobacteraceae bacterium]|nr:hypothetical protein [Solirubrobacteraceae bacterium]
MRRRGRGEWTLTVRDGPRVTHERHATLGDAVTALEQALLGLEPGAARDETRVFSRRIEPAAQIAARLELSGPGGERGGVDLRGDGSAEAFTGRLRRQIVEQRAHESAGGALERALSGERGG